MDQEQRAGQTAAALVSRGEASGRQTSQGQSLIELALVLPILLLLVLGTLDLGRVFFAYVNVAGAAQHGARVASDARYSDAEIVSAVQAYPAGTLTIAAGDVSVSPSPTRVRGQPVTVTVSYTFVPVTPIVTEAAWGGSSLVVQSSSTMAVQ